MSDPKEHRLIVKIERLRTPGLVDTLSSQAPDVARSLEQMAREAFAEIAAMPDGGWRIVSHSLGFTAGLAVLTLIIAR
jgi:hypothetical protein